MGCIRGRACVVLLFKGACIHSFNQRPPSRPHLTELACFWHTLSALPSYHRGMASLILSGPDGALNSKARELARVFDGLYAESIVAPAHQGGSLEQDVGCGGAEAGEALIGKTVSVYWPCDHQWYTAKVVGHEVGTQPLESLPSTATPGGEGTITSGARGGAVAPEGSSTASLSQRTQQMYLLEYQDGIGEPSWVQMPCVDIFVLRKDQGAKGGKLCTHGKLRTHQAVHNGHDGQSARSNGSAEILPDRSSCEGERDGEKALADHPTGSVGGWRSAHGSRGALKVGTEVYARYRDGRWYPALVSAILADGYLVDWQDGDTEDTVFPRSLPLSVRLSLFSLALFPSLFRAISLLTCLPVSRSLALFPLFPLLSLLFSLSFLPLLFLTLYPLSPPALLPLSLSFSLAHVLSLSRTPCTLVLNTPHHPWEPLTGIHAHTYARTQVKLRRDVCVVHRLGKSKGACASRPSVHLHDSSGGSEVRWQTYSRKRKRGGPIPTLSARLSPLLLLSSQPLLPYCAPCHRQRAPCRTLAFSTPRTAPILSIPTISLPCYHIIAGWETVRSARKIKGRAPQREAATQGLAGSRGQGRGGEQLAGDTASASAHANVAATGRSEEHEDEARRGKAQAYEKVVSMTCEHVVHSLSGDEGLADVVPLLLHHRLDGEGLLQVTDCPPPSAPCCTRSPDSTRHRVACKYNGISCRMTM